jgi:hypothetical protein
MALGSYVFLYTLNPNLVRFNLNINQTAPMTGSGVDLVTGPLVAKGIMSPAGKLNPLNTSGSGAKITAYGYAGDTTSDTNSSQARGDHDNLLTEGSVALSPDVIANLQPQHGAAVYVGETFVGYYDDKTASEYNGRQITNTVDRYDPTGSLGGNSYSQSGGQIRIDNNNIRQSTSNPSK